MSTKRLDAPVLTRYSEIRTGHTSAVTRVEMSYIGVGAHSGMRP